MREREFKAVMTFWVLLTFDKFAYCRLMAKVKSRRRGDQKEIEDCLTKGGKRLPIKKKKIKKKNLLKGGESSRFC